MIPSVIHFIWVALGEQLNELQMLCIRSAVLNTKCHVVLHTDDASIQIPGVETRVRVFPSVINGTPFNKDDDTQFLSGKRVSHLKDIVRLEILYAEGGIYSDLDVLWLRDPWRFLDTGKKVIVGYDNKAYKILCNAVMFAEPQNALIKEYLDWTVKIYPPKKYWTPANPYKLWNGHSEDALYVDKYHFFPLSWSKDKSVSFDLTERSICIHLYQSSGKKPDGEVIESVRRRLV